MSSTPKKTKAARPRGREAARRAAAPSPSLNLYRRIAVGFVVAVALLLGAVVYVSTVSATIHVTPVKETVTASFLADVVRVPTKESEVRGQVVAATVGRSQAFQVTPSAGSYQERPGTARGTVTITNTSTRTQPLVATTRLLTPDGTLFRIDASVTVPAGGTADVAAHADEEGETGDIPAGTRMTIPGLSETFQAQIYAESKTAFAGGISSIAVISQNDLDRSALELRGLLEEDAKAALRAQLSESFTGEAFSFEVTEQTSDVPVGTETSAFTLTMSVQAVAVFYDRAALEGIASRRLYAQLAPGETFTTLNTSDLQVSVDTANAPSGTANVRVYLDGEAITSNTSDSLDPGRFVGLSEEEVERALVREGIATDVLVEFRPFWIRRVPRLEDHVYVEIE